MKIISSLHCRVSGILMVLHQQCYIHSVALPVLWHLSYNVFRCQWQSAFSLQTFMVV